MKKSEITKKKILEGALKIFEEKGFAAATTKEIAQASGVAEGTIYKYYKSKDELLKAIGLDFITGIGEKIIVDNAKSIMIQMKDYSIEKKLKALILERLNIMDQYSSHLNVLMVEVRYDMDIRSIMLDKIVPKMFTMMEQVLNDAKEKGEIKNCDNLTLQIGRAVV